MNTRREFLTGSGAAALGAALCSKADAAAGEWRNRQSGMSYRQLGRTNYMISEVVMGGNTISPTNYEHVLEALDHGLNYLDTAPAYGNGESQRGYARVIQSRPRDRFFLNTKVSLWDINRDKVYQTIFESLPASEQAKLRTAAQDEIERSKASSADYFVNYFKGQRAELDAAALANVMEAKYGRQIDRKKNYRDLIVQSIEDSLRTMGTDHLDLMMCPHGANTPYEVKNYPEIFEAFEALKKAGKVRHLGVSAHTDPAGVLNAAIETKMYSAAMVAYNIVNNPFVRSAIANAKKANMGVIAMKVARAVHTGRSPGANPERVKLITDAVPGRLKTPQKAYVWALRNPHLTAVISEMITAEHVKENLPLAAPKSA